MQTTETKSLLRYSFDSWGEFVDYSARKRVAPHGDSSRQRDYGFSNTPNFEAALKLAREGWPEGVKLAAGFSTALIDKLSNRIERLDPVPDMEGVGIDIASFVSGVPECWLRYETQLADGAGKVIKMVYSASATAAVDASVMIKKGAIAAALIQLLEIASVRVELWVLPYCSHGGSNYRHEQLVKIKDAEQPLDLNRMIFAIAHPSTMRRLGFSVCEQLPDAWQRRMGIGGGYGSSDTPAKDLVESADIYLTSMNEWEDEDRDYYTSPEKTEAWILKKLESQGVSIEKE